MPLDRDERIREHAHTAWQDIMDALSRYLARARVQRPAASWEERLEVLMAAQLALEAAVETAHRTLAVILEHGERGEAAAGKALGITRESSEQVERQMDELERLFMLGEFPRE